jgi:ssRNA-specific RNase YbeY (16S rRNA maturation enzyme)
MRITFFDEEGVGMEAAGAIEKVLDIAAEAEGVDFCVNIKLTGDDEMRKLNAVTER